MGFEVVYKKIKQKDDEVMSARLHGLILNIRPLAFVF